MKKVQETLRWDEDIVEYFQRLAERTGIPYQTLINMSLRKFANEKTELIIRLDRPNKAV